MKNYRTWLRVKFALQAVVLGFAGVAAGNLSSIAQVMGAALAGVLIAAALELLWRAVFPERPKE